MRTDDEILEWVAREAETALHPSCTAKMGGDGDPLAVLDGQHPPGGERAAVAKLAFMPDLIDVVEVDADRLGRPAAAAGPPDKLDAGIDALHIVVVSARLIARARMSSYSSFAVGSTPRAGRGA